MCYSSNLCCAFELGHQEYKHEKQNSYTKEKLVSLNVCESCNTEKHICYILAIGLEA